MKPIRKIKRDNFFEAEINKLRVDIIDWMNDSKF